MVGACLENEQCLIRSHGAKPAVKAGYNPWHLEAPLGTSLWLKMLCGLSGKGQAGFPT